MSRAWQTSSTPVSVHPPRPPPPSHETAKLQSHRDVLCSKRFLSIGGTNQIDWMTLSPKSSSYSSGGIVGLVRERVVEQYQDNRDLLERLGAELKEAASTAERKNRKHEQHSPAIPKQR